MSKKYVVTIEETLSKNITVESSSIEEALATVKTKYRHAEIILDSDDYVGTDFAINVELTKELHEGEE